jgi:prepilin-type N-terminal cleavage/methylation domain-containing protein
VLQSKSAAALGSGSRPGRRAISCRASSGFSFIEILVATLIVGSALVAAMGALTSATQSQSALATGPTTALTLANEIHTLALALPRAAGDGTPAHAGGEVAVLDDLDGASFSPPIDARRGSLSSSTGWSQAVRVDPVALAAPTVADDDRSSSDTLLKLTVTVRQGADAAGTYSWWINP